MLLLQLNAYEPVVRYVHELITNKDETRPKYTKTATCENNNCWTISVTGHSLGGGIATIVGSTLGIPVKWYIHYVSNWGLRDVDCSFKLIFA